MPLISNLQYRCYAQYKHLSTAHAMRTHLLPPLRMFHFMLNLSSTLKSAPVIVLQTLCYLQAWAFYTLGLSV